jgi:hypothetical protein
VRVVVFFAYQPGFEVNPACFQRARTPVGTFESVGVVNCPLAVEQDGEISAGFFEPLLHNGQGSKRNDKNAGVEFCEFGLTVTQLCNMLAAGYSAKVTEKDKQGVSAFENFAERDLFAFSRGESEGGGGGVYFEFQVSGSKYQVKLRLAQTSLWMMVMKTSRAKTENRMVMCAGNNKNIP